MGTTSPWTLLKVKEASMKIYNLEDHVSGDTFDELGFRLYDEGNNPIPLTGASIEAQFKLTPESSPSLTLTSSGGGITLDPVVTNRFTIDEQVISLTPGFYYYDIEITFTDGRVKTYIGGSWRILQGITS